MSLIIQRSSRNLTRPILLVIFVVAVSLSWLAIPYLVDGSQLLGDTGRLYKTGQLEQSQLLGQSLGRIYRTPTGEELTATFATDDYFAARNQNTSTLLFDPADHLIFFVSETVHTGRLPARLPEFTLLRPDNKNIKPVHVEGPEDVQHHRVSYVYFRKTGEDGLLALPGDGSPFRLVVENGDERRADYVGWFEWTYPAVLPKDMAENSGFTPVMVAALALGLLAATLTPCMLQLSVMYVALLGGTAAQGGTEHRKRALWFALAFTGGFVGLFAMVGGLIGWSGQFMQILLGQYATPISIVSGVIVFAIGLYLAYQARMPLVCKLPLSRVSHLLKTHSVWASMFLSVGFAFGCISCFGGAIIGTLAIYVGMLNSVSAGAALMGLFALAVAVPFLFAAIMLEKSETALSFLNYWLKPVRYFTAFVVMFFGIVLMTDNYHTLSDLIYPYLGLG